MVGPVLERSTNWQDFISVYPAKQLTSHKDKLVALQGLASSLAKRMRDKYLAGTVESRSASGSAVAGQGPRVARRRTTASCAGNALVVLGLDRLRHQSYTSPDMGYAGLCSLWQGDGPAN